MESSSCGRPCGVCLAEPQQIYLCALDTAHTKSVVSQGARAARREANKAGILAIATDGCRSTNDGSLSESAGEPGGKGALCLPPDTELDRTAEVVVRAEPIPLLTREIWFAHKVGKAMEPAEGYAFVFDGLTTVAQRQDRVRYAIIANDLAAERCGRRADAIITFAQMFSQIYGREL